MNAGAHYRYIYGPTNPSNVNHTGWEVHCACGFIGSAPTERRSMNLSKRHLEGRA